MKKFNQTYLVPVEMTCSQQHKWLKIKVYEYKIFADTNEKQFSSIQFTDINGFIIGKHMPTKLNSIYDKTAVQVKNTTVKAVSGIKHVVDTVADVALETATEVKEDLSQTVKDTAGVAVSTFNKFKKIFSKSK